MKGSKMTIKKFALEICQDDLVSIGGVEYHVICISINSFNELLLWLNSIAPVNGTRVHLQLIADSFVLINVLEG